MWLDAKIGYILSAGLFVCLSVGAGFCAFLILALCLRPHFVGSDVWKSRKGQLQNGA